ENVPRPRRGAVDARPVISVSSTFCALATAAYAPELTARATSCAASRLLKVRESVDRAWSLLSGMCTWKPHCATKSLGACFLYAMAADPSDTATIATHGIA